VPQSRGDAKYDPGTDSERAFNAWKALIPDGKLPPMPPSGGQPPK
jgi:hypothetical protein